jgi:hypothetical protein
VLTPTASCTGDPGELDRACTLVFGNQKIAVSAIGGAQVLGSDTRFALPYDSALTERLYSASYHGDLIVLFEVGNGEEGWAGVTRLQPPDFHMVWHVHVPTFNLGPGAIDGSSLYLSAWGFVSRIDLEGGRYIWQHAGLYDSSSGRFNAFLVPLVTRSEVLFYEDVGMQQHKPKVVRVQKDGGAFLIEDSE